MALLWVQQLWALPVIMEELGDAPLPSGRQPSMEAHEGRRHSSTPGMALFKSTRTAHLED